jgi:hypothetical protein
MMNTNNITTTTSDANDNYNANNNNNNRILRIPTTSTDSTAGTGNSYSTSHVSTSTTSTGMTTGISNFVTSMNIMDTSNGSRTSNATNTSSNNNNNNHNHNHNHNFNNNPHHNINNDNAYHIHNRSGSPSSIDSRDNNNTQQYNHPHHQNNTNNTNNKKKKSTTSKKKNKNPLRVLGIAIIVDQKGAGARMLARYPTNNSNNNSNNIHGDDDDDDDNDDDEDDRHRGIAAAERDSDATATAAASSSNKSLSEDDDLFFTLTARQMAKLFRTKKALCNEPMTLRVNKTVFCCHAVLLDNNNNIVNNSNSNNNDNENKNNNTATSSGNDSIEEDGGQPLPPPPPPPRDASSVSSSVVEVDNDNENNNKDDQLRLFSIVVALSGSTQQSALPFSSFWGDAGGGGGASGEDRSDLERYLRQLNNDKKGKGNDETITTTAKKEKSNVDNHHNRSSNSRKKKKEQTAGRVSSVFLAIRRVHISLVRFCRALHREENRCGYVTHQSRALFRLRNERQKQWETMYSKHHRPGSSSGATMTTNAVGGGGGGGGDHNAGHHHHHHHHTPQHSRQNSFIGTPGSGDSSMLDDTTLKDVFGNNNVSGETLSAVEQEQEKEQEILELMLACNPQDHHSRNQQQYQSEQQDLPPSFQQKQYGNMIRDLVAVFHSLSRNDYEYPPTPSSLLCERDAVVYVNQHVAIPIEAAGLNGYSAAGVASASSSRQHLDGGSSVVRPYYTLLFPHASPSELSQTFHASGSAPPQQMEHLLLTVNPQKSMTQISIDANLPMHTTMQIASSLVAHGACIPSPVVTSRSRLTCRGNDSMQRIPELALDFSQAFPGINLFGVVSFLTTSSRHLGDAIAVLLDTENEEGSWLRESLLASPKYRYYNNNRGRSGSGGGGGNGGIAGDSPADVGAAADLIKDTIINGTHALFLDEESYSPIHASYASSRGGGAHPPTSSGIQDQNSPPISVHRWLKDLEELLYAIAIWLLSHRVLTQLQEYMVLVAKIEPSPPSPSSIKADSSSSLIVPPSLSSLFVPPSSLPATATTTTSSSSSTTPAPAATTPTISRSTNNDSDENLFKELTEMGYLNGDISIMALSWRMAIDSQKLRRWGLRHKRIRVVSRVPTSGDDWEQPTLPT